MPAPSNAVHARPFRLRPLALSSTLAAASLLAACSSAPPYERPALAVPDHYREAPAAGSDASTWQPAQPLPLADGWWSVFGDATLDRLQHEATAGNPGIAQSLAKLRAARAALASSDAARWPTLGLSAGQTRSAGPSSNSSSSDGSSSSSRARTQYSLGATASWELDLWGRLSDAAESSRASLQASVAQTYFSLRAAEAQSQLLARTEEAYARSLALTRNRLAAGVVSPADVAQAESQLLTVQAQRSESATTRAQLEHALAVLTGVAPAAFALPPTAELPLPPAVPLALPSQLLQRRPDIVAAERRVAAANAQIGVARAAYFPALTLSASGGYRNDTLANLISAPNLFWSLGPSLALSLFDGGARRAAVESARADTDQAAASYRQTVLAALQEVEDNLVASANLRGEESLQRQAVDAARRAQTITENQYRAGTVAYLNVLSAQTTTLSAERSLLTVRANRLTAAVVLLRNLAGTWEPVPGEPPPQPVAEAGG
ncbi:MAG: Outer membrane protein OprM [Paracidovorax wautersii]|uniref:Outer membrane protein OprM n=1 Tax=Paracidovorax wautersii TaxID=1177982 RepID=A0A7V8FPS9_9BURK|nr:MAG: Outer membrane protein OprM [Paracidovorax wautersii]